RRRWRARSGRAARGRRRAGPRRAAPRPGRRARAIRRARWPRRAARAAFAAGSTAACRRRRRRRTTGRGCGSRRARRGGGGWRRRAPRRRDRSRLAPLLHDAEQVAGDLADLDLLGALGDAIAPVVAIDVLERIVPRVTDAAVDLDRAVGGVAQDRKSTR